MPDYTGEILAGAAGVVVVVAILCYVCNRACDGKARAEARRKRKARQVTPEEMLKIRELGMVKRTTGSSSGLSDLVSGVAGGVTRPLDFVADALPDVAGALQGAAEEGGKTIYAGQRRAFGRALTRPFRVGVEYAAAAVDAVVETVSNLKVFDERKALDDAATAEVAKNLAKYCQFVRTVPLFADMGDSEIEAAAREVHIRHFKEGEIIYNEGDNGNEAWVVEVRSRARTHVRVASASRPRRVRVLSSLSSSRAAFAPRATGGAMLCFQGGVVDGILEQKGMEGDAQLQAGPLRLVLWRASSHPHRASQPAHHCAHRLQARVHPGAHLCHVRAHPREEGGSDPRGAAL